MSNEEIFGLIGRNLDNVTYWWLGLPWWAFSIVSALLLVSIMILIREFPMWGGR